MFVYPRSILVPQIVRHESSFPFWFEGKSVADMSVDIVYELLASTQPGPD